MHSNESVCGKGVILDMEEVFRVLIISDSTCGWNIHKRVKYTSILISVLGKKPHFDWPKYFLWEARVDFTMYRLCGTQCTLGMIKEVKIGSYD